MKWLLYIAGGYIAYKLYEAHRQAQAVANGTAVALPPGSIPVPGGALVPANYVATPVPSNYVPPPAFQAPQKSYPPPMTFRSGATVPYPPTQKQPAAPVGQGVAPVIPLFKPITGGLPQ